MTYSRHFRRYIAMVFGAAVFALGVAVGVTVIVDPYWLFDGPRWAGLNEKKPHAYSHVVLAKRKSAQRAEIKTVILGNSRMDIGFDPKSTAWPEALRPVFNLAVPGQGLGGDLKNLKHVFRDRHPAMAVIGLDFHDFLFGGSVSVTGAKEPKVPEHAIFQSLKEISQTTLSLTGLVDSLLTIAAQSNPNTATMTRQGFNPFRNYLDHVRTEGHFAIFHQRNFENFRGYLRKPKTVVAVDGQLSPSFDELIRLIRWCKDRGMQVKLVIYPYHAHILEGFRLTGLWTAFEEWKRLITNIVARERHRGGQMALTLWDFSGYHAYASEPVPKSGDTRTHMRWYWEAGHFKSALGDLMLREMTGESVDPEFGVELTPNNVGEVIERIRRAGPAYGEAQPAAAAYIRDLVRRLSNRPG